ncbi:DNA-binding NarL/FixJ family response regulator [Kitasatospora sp. MAP12-15]|uniref:response regulator transcription factor n=1 Tax=unclassified Kitasatospora TaxID=2633591 RepID=UPI002476CB84|nr:response regulator transcription factor [Kitasatospora sp. MAP12-44]MDH6113689.1 DNA-binding NarL/FixJ family response regulator [Kitasatospora sp. MAP12-44]
MNPPDSKITVLLVDDHTLVRAGVREILESHDDIVVVSEAATSSDAITEARRHSPDIILLDVELPGGEPVDTVRQLRALVPRSQIIMLSMYDGPQLLRRLISAGIRGYLLKSVDRQQLLSAIRSVRNGPDGMVLAVSRDSLAQMQQVTEGVLSARELEILELVADALSNSQISTRLAITEATVKRHLSNVFVKLGAVSRIDAVNKAIASSLITSKRDHQVRRFPAP